MSKAQEKSNTLVPVSKAVQPVVRCAYWDRVSAFYKNAFRTLLIVLPLFTVLFMIICARAFSYDSIFSFFKDLGSSASFISSDRETVTYTYEPGESTVLSYRGGIAAVTAAGAQVYSQSGELIMPI